MSFGIVPEGFTRPTLLEIKADIEADQLAEISAGLDVSPASPDGMRNDITARQDSLVWELAQVIYEILDPDKAEGVSLINTCKLTGTVPQAATYTTVTASVTGTTGTVLGTDQVFAALEDNPDTLFTPAAPFTFPSNGTFSTTFRAVDTGPIDCPAGKLTIVSTGPATGTWSAVTNALDGVLGLPADNDARLRLRRANELTATGSSSVSALQTDLSQAKNATGQPLVNFVRVFENDTQVTDALGRPRNSIEVLIVPSGTTAAGELGLFLWQHKGSGPTAYGSASDTFTDPQTGETRTIAYSVATSVNIFVRVNISVDATYPGDAAFKQALVDKLNANSQPGAALAKIWDVQTAADQTGVVNVPLVQQGLSTNPTGVVDIAIGGRARAVYDTSRVQIVLV